jgi:hypothetical protein
MLEKGGFLEQRAITISTIAAVGVLLTGCSVHTALDKSYTNKVLAGTEVYVLCKQPDGTYKTQLKQTEPTSGNIPAKPVDPYADLDSSYFPAAVQEDLDDLNDCS